MTQETTTASEARPGTPILELHGVTKQYGALTAVGDVSLTVMEGTHHALIGPNGAGKSTLFNLIAGTLPVTSGHILFDGHDVTKRSAASRAKHGLAKTFQHSSLFLSMTARENVALGAQRVAGLGMALHKRAAKPRDGVDDVADQALADVGLTDRSHVNAGALSHGERRQLEVAVALALKPRLLLLDEPAAGMSPAESARFSELIESLPRSVTVVIIEHDIDLVFRLAEHVSVLHLGRLLADGSPEAIRANDEVQHAYLGESDLEDLFTAPVPEVANDA